MYLLRLKNYYYYFFMDFASKTRCCPFSPATFSAIFGHKNGLKLSVSSRDFIHISFVTYYLSYMMNQSLKASLLLEFSSFNSSRTISDRWGNLYECKDEETCMNAKTVKRRRIWNHFHHRRWLENSPVKRSNGRSWMQNPSGNKINFFNLKETRAIPLLAALIGCVRVCTLQTGMHFAAKYRPMLLGHVPSNECNYVLLGSWFSVTDWQVNLVLPCVCIYIDRLCFTCHLWI